MTSTDQMITPFGGMGIQMRGNLMKAKFFAAMIFLDHWTDNKYIYLQRNFTTLSTMSPKTAYDVLVQSYGYSVQWYHVNNSKYTKPASKVDDRQKQQAVSYYGVGHQSQNVITENRYANVKLLKE